LRGVKLVGRRFRADSGAPQRFGRVDVADAGDNALIEQSNLDADASSLPPPSPP